MGASPVTRRPIKARDSRWAAVIAGALARAGIRPNVISVLSAVFAAAAGLLLAITPHYSPPPSVVLWLAAAIAVQCRLLCNLFDGMVAVEGGFKTKSGELFNELPDRFADAAILVGCGYAAGARPHGIELGWVAAVLAVIVAYVRTLGAATGAGQNFMGPMAKQHRMATVTAACVFAAIGALIEPLAGARWSSWILWAALAVIVIGEIVTIWRRASWIARTLELK
jgi:phosphatidylglycerophosphate synthase